MENIVVPSFGEGDAEPSNGLQRHIDEMMSMVRAGHWCRDYANTDDATGRRRHCTLGMVNKIIADG